MKKRLLFFLTLFLAGVSFASENPKVDSLRNYLSTAKHDTARSGAMIFLGEEIYMSDPDSALLLWQEAEKITFLALKKNQTPAVKKRLQEYYGLALNNLGFLYFRKDGKKALDYFQRSLKVQEDVGDDRGIAGSLNNIASVYHVTGDITNALDYYERSLKKKEKLGDVNSVAVSLNNIGNIYSDLGEIEKGLDYYHQSLKIHEKANDKDGIAFAFHNIAMVYDAQGDTAKALDYYNRSMKIRRELGDLFGLASSMGNLGALYQTRGNIQKAKEFHEESLKIKEKIDDRKGAASSLVNLGNIYDREGDRKKALEYYMRALSLWEGVQDKKGIAHTLNNIAGLYKDDGDLPKALEFGTRGFTVAKELGYPQNMAQSAKLLFEVYKLQNNGMKALEMHELYVQMKDSVSNENTKKAALKKQLQYDYEKKTAADSVSNAEKAKVEEIKHQQEIAKQKLYTYSGIIGFTLMLLIAGISFNAFRQKKKANQVISHQKNILEEKQKEILDSITYAERIQSAILAKEEDIKKQLPESFLLYKPKAIVAGDFYFFETTSSHLFYAAADCTGHGVPGALVSVVCSNALSRCVKEFRLTDPGQILDRARELVVETFNKSGKDLKDGMDISLLVRENATGKFSWAGANNSLWIIRGNELIEYKSNKQPIGFSEHVQPFTTHHPDTQKGDMLLLYTDGYADQFGGDKGKKFKYKQLQERLIAIASLPVDEQKSIIEKNFDEWKGNLEQVDDVCIIGIRV